MLSRLHSLFRKQGGGMSVTDEKIIQLSKSKIVVLLLISIVFVWLGWWMFSLDAVQIQSQRRFNSPEFIHGLGLVAIILFGLGMVVAIIKFFDKKPGLVLNSQGIYDNGSGVSAGFIPRSEITGFGIWEFQKQKLLIVLLEDPEKYIEAGNVFRRALNRANYKLCGSPIAITSNALKINLIRFSKSATRI
ncbi:STM3941 family protein [Methylophilus flavus]|uniref:STM3941 family protein n=1 Tax=Methylophilus flavus TaxID=640084 RepID=A0ABW3PB00_9PROT